MLFKALAFTLCALALVNGATQAPVLAVGEESALRSGYYNIVHKASKDPLVSFSDDVPISVSIDREFPAAFAEWFVLRVGLIEYKMWNVELETAASLDGGNIITGGNAAHFDIRPAGNGSYVIINPDGRGVWAAPPAGKSQERPIRVEPRDGSDAQKWVFGKT
ncbi:hypothetical protein DFH09DRAFT_1319026 [Mycena vulgaris]|nr:hypothetical protein DFH09DRAFT_1319026 [Mycena vulgaris]